ncbi:hypothetical protein BMS3Abin03_01179 [bacterium BMS3Abin03]|nr:hypothetical protein BMS3Abin03_01179 [bacterium BMS3Abin03]
MLKRLLLIIFSLSVITYSIAQEKQESKGKFSGYMFGDYYYFLNNHKNDLKDQRGIWFRRIYFTYDYKINKSFSTRLRLEMGNEFNFEEAKTMVPFVKDAWLKYKFSKQVFIIGINPTPTFQILEKLWGYRSVEKTPLDLQRMASSRDFGLALKGQLDNSGKFKYHLMFSNGSSNKQEINKGKSGLLSVAFFPTKEFVIEIYGDYADRTGNTDWYTLQAFLGYQTKTIRTGLLFADQTRQKEDAANQKLRLASFFLVDAVSEHVSLLGRVDRILDPNPQGDKISFVPFDPTVKSTFFILGADWHPVKDVSFIPNVEIVKYDENNEGVSPANDVIGRVTFFWKF